MNPLCSEPSEPSEYQVTKQLRSMRATVNDIYDEFQWSQEQLRILIEGKSDTDTMQEVQTAIKECRQAIKDKPDRALVSELVQLSKSELNATIDSKANKVELCALEEGKCDNATIQAVQADLKNFRAAQAQSIWRRFGASILVFVIGVALGAGMVGTRVSSLEAAMNEKLAQLDQRELFQVSSLEAAMNERFAQLDQRETVGQHGIELWQLSAKLDRQMSDKKAAAGMEAADKKAASDKEVVDKRPADTKPAADKQAGEDPLKYRMLEHIEKLLIDFDTKCNGPSLRAKLSVHLKDFGVLPHLEELHDTFWAPAAEVAGLSSLASTALVFWTLVYNLGLLGFYFWLFKCLRRDGVCQ